MLKANKITHNYMFVLLAFNSLGQRDMLVYSL